MQGLTESKFLDTPFRMGVSPSEVVSHNAWREARDGILAALADGASRIALLGGTGSGRTLLLHNIAGALREQNRPVVLVDGGRLPEEIEPEAVLLVDDADRLDGAGLSRCVRHPAPCILAGPRRLRNRLPAPLVSVTLSPLLPDEVARFVAVRLAAAGRRRDLLQPDAILALARLSGGVPRQINVLAGSAVFLAELDGAAEVSQRHVEEAAAMRDGGESAAAPPGEDDDAADGAMALPTSMAALPLTPTADRAEQVSPRPARRKGSLASRVAILATATAAVLLAVAIVASHPGTRTAAPDKQAASLAQKAPERAAPAAPQPQQQVAQAPVAPAPAIPSRTPSAAPPTADAVPAVNAPLAAAPALPQPMSAEAEPALPPSRVVVQYRGGGDADADRLVAALAKADARFDHAETHQVSSTTRNPTIRFFYREDVGAAWSLKAALDGVGGTWQVSNYTRNGNKPRRGTLEVWLP